MNALTWGRCLIWRGTAVNGLFVGIKKEPKDWEAAPASRATQHCHNCTQVHEKLMNT
jgi:hypothetical protein